MSSMTALAIISTAAAAGSGVVSTVSNYKNEKAQEAANRYNEEVARDDAARTRAEYAMNAGLQRANARKQIASAKNQMGAMSNIGTSAEDAVVDAYLNLSSDLAAMKYQYDNTAIKYLNEAENHRFNKKVSRMNKAGAILGGVFNTTSAVAGGAFDYYMAGYGKLWGKPDSVVPNVSGGGYRTGDGMYGTSVGWDRLSDAIRRKV